MLKNLENDTVGRRLLMFAVAAFCGVASSGQILIADYTPDDYLASDIFLPVAFLMHQGRFLPALCMGFLSNLGVHLPELTIGLGMILFVLFGAVISFVVDICASRNTSINVKLLGCAIIACSPYFSGLFMYRVVIIISALMLLMLLFYFYHLDQDQQRSALFTINGGAAAFFLALAAGSYPIALGIAGVVSILLFLRNAIFHKFFFGNVRLAIKLAWPFAAGIILYVFFYALTRNSAGRNNWDQRTSLPPLTKNTIASARCPLVVSNNLPSSNTNPGTAFESVSAVEGLFHEATGLDLPVIAPTKGDIAACASSPKWPAPGYLQIKGGSVLACL